MKMFRWRSDVLKYLSLSGGWNLALVLPLAAVVLSEGVVAEPFVIGFERFARHGELAAADAGELLVNELNCTACHPFAADWSRRKGAPNLQGAALSFQRAWLTRYLADPSAIDPGTTMPDVMQHLSPQRKAEAIKALVAFLSKQQRPFATIKAGGATPVVYEFWKHGDPERGKRLYHTVGCVACHQPDQGYESVDTTPSAVDELLERLDQDEIEELGLAAMARRVASIPHGDVSKKYTRRSLTMMLLDPARVRPSGRMPNLRLAPDEAADIASHLMRLTGEADGFPTQDSPAQESLAGDSVGGAVDGTLIERGRQWFEQLKCASCHDANGANRPPTAMPLSELDFSAGNSCVAAPTGDMPVYSLDLEQQEAIRQGMARAFDAKTGQVKRRDAKLVVRNQLIQHNCVGCHARATDRDEIALGGVGRFRKAYFETVGQVDLGDEGRLPPPLTGVGAKLTAKTLAGVFAAKTTPYRSYLTIRMPAYHSGAIKDLAKLLEIADSEHVQNQSKAMPKPNKQQMAEWLSAGQQLANTGCVQCHLFAGEAVPGVVGIDLNGITSRVRPDWFQAFVLNPAELKSRTRMPTFFPDGKSNSPQLLSGNVDQQIASLWYYLGQLNEGSLPEKIRQAHSRDYELSPTDRPLILRTFMDKAGTHAIAVGFSAGIHYAWDSEACRPAIGWRGRFLDARGTWFERFTPPAEPLGTQVLSIDSDGPRWFGTNPLNDDPPVPVTPAFSGYKLDSEGVPTMLYRLGDYRVEDKIEPGDSILNRQVRVERDELDNSEANDGEVMPLRWQVPPTWRLKAELNSDQIGSLFEPRGSGFESGGSLAFKNEAGLVVRLSGDRIRLAAPPQADAATRQWIVLDPPCTLSLEYQW